MTEALPLGGAPEPPRRFSGIDDLPPPGECWLDVLADLDPEELEVAIATVSDVHRASPHRAVEILKTDWTYLARREQMMPEGDWTFWLLKAGRGFGKTRVGAETIVKWAFDDGEPGTFIIASTEGDLERYCLRGPSGVLSISPEHKRPEYRSGKNPRLIWPNGNETLLFSGERPERLRGPNLGRGWCDELAAWTRLAECWDNLEFALRESEHPRVVITTTPKPRKLLRDLVSDPACVVTGGSTYDNAVNLAPPYLSRMRRRYEGTAIGRQELHAAILDEAQGALWKREWFDAHRARETPELVASAVAIDPPASSTQDASEAGIVVVGADEVDRGYLLEDLSGHHTPNGWARKAVLAFFRHGATAIVAERNNGGEMVENTIRMVVPRMHDEGLIPDPYVRVETVWASRGKAARAEPVAARYEQGRVHHVGTFSALEDQCCTWEPLSGDRSPDRLDALVWGLTYVLGISVVPDGESEEIGRLRMTEYDDGWGATLGDESESVATVQW